MNRSTGRPDSREWGGRITPTNRWRGCRCIRRVLPGSISVLYLVSTGALVHHGVMRQALYLPTLFVFSLAASASTFETSTSCFVFTTMYDPNSCTMGSGFPDWPEVTQATVTGGGSDSTGYGFRLNSGAGPYGEGNSTATASISGVVTGPATVCFSGSAMGGSGGLSNAGASMGDQSVSIEDYQYLGFCVVATPSADSFTAYVTTEDVGYATLSVSVSAVAAGVGPEPSSGLLAPIRVLSLLAGVRRSRWLA